MNEIMSDVIVERIYIFRKLKDCDPRWNSASYVCNPNQILFMDCSKFLLDIVKCPLGKVRNSYHQMFLFPSNA